MCAIQQWRAARRIFDEYLKQQSSLRCLDAEASSSKSAASVDDLTQHLALVQEGLNTSITVSRPCFVLCIVVFLGI